MKAQLVKLAREIATLVLPATQRHGGLVLPAKHLRLCGPEFWDDDKFIATGAAEAQRLVTRLGVTADTRLLDVGCGVGRLAFGLLTRVGEMKHYVGLDVNARSIRWCRRHLTPAHPGFTFTHIDVRNLRYNPGGRGLAGDFRFPFEDGAFDAINLFSVFSHMTTDDVRLYLREFARILAPDGRIFLTAFVEDGVPDMTENPEGYRTRWSGPLHGVRYERGFFTGLVEEAGFTITDWQREAQTAFYLEKRRGQVDRQE